MHDLCCRGIKDYMQALRNVQDYNLAKILQRKASIPSVSDVYHEAICHWNIFYAVQMDIENYNYIDLVFNDYWAGRLTEENKKLEREKFRKEEEDKSKLKLNAGVVYLTPDQAPNGMAFKRNNSDMMNNLFVNIVCMAFTNIQELWNSQKEDKESQRQKETLIELEKVKKIWTSEMTAETNEQMSRLEKTVMKNMD